VLHADQSIVDQNAVGVEPPPLPPSALILDVLASDPVVAALTAPLAGADPCGPDLDAEGDPGYLNFFAQAELILPSSYKCCGRGIAARIVLGSGSPTLSGR
jgi:type VI secretion system protein ImpA